MQNFLNQNLPTVSGNEQNYPKLIKLITDISNPGNVDKASASIVPNENPGTVLLPDAGSFSLMPTHPPQEVSDEFVQNVASGLITNCPTPYREIIETSLILNYVECKLQIMLQDPKERARFLPDDFAQLIINELSKIACYMPLTEPQTILLTLLKSFSGLREQFTYDKLFNIKYIDPVFRLQAKADGNNIIEVPIKQLMHFLNNDFPVLSLICLYDDERMLTEDDLLYKARSIGSAIGVNVDNIFAEIFSSYFDEYHNKFRISVTANQFQTRLPTIKFFGQQGALLQQLAPFYWHDAYGNLRSVLMPLGFICHPDVNIPKPVYFIPDKLHLFGLERLYHQPTCFCNYLSPNLNVAIDNVGNPDALVMSWWGGLQTIDRVDFSPLAGRQVTYLFNPADFHGNAEEARHCLNVILQKLTQLGCIVNYLDVTSLPPPMMNYGVQGVSPSPPMWSGHPPLSPINMPRQPHTAPPPGMKYDSFGELIRAND